ncbi:MAG: ribosomal RNA small subunit methyltransferase A [Candidatus Pacebacteria bacterium]|nr:ribosomal RNA small subunit methyltransferase A [Candidatus Paceibacterota bacterium]MBP9866675.1 ribosomal RNA small subunit methyltransferase A [Candidatus Paceibacterota bacterium]
MIYRAPKKSLGQNFLTSIPARIAIVNAGNLTKEDTVLEIGPGRGFLTKGLLESGARVLALEKDRELIPILSETFSKEIQTGQLTLVEGDVLTFSLEEYVSSLQTTSKITAKNYKLIANIPYYITGAILSKYLSSTCQPSHMVVLIQKEVAERIVARDKKESILSLAVKAYGDPKIVYRVNKGSFNPIPSVDSAVLSIENISRINFINKTHEETFFTLVKAGFAHKRKFTISNIRQTFPHIDCISLFNEYSLSEKIRSEDISLAVWLSLSKKIATIQ